MKIRKIAAVSVTAFVLCSVGLFSACSTQDDSGDGIPTIAEMKSAYLSQSSDKTISADDISFRCYGAFDSVCAVFVDVVGYDYNTSIEYEAVSDFVFMYPSEQKMKAYSDGTFYSLTQAYEEEILSFEEIKTVFFNYKNGELVSLS